MVRDRHRDQEHFILDIKAKTESHENRVSKLYQGLIKPERINIVKQSMAANLIQRLVSKYSLGLEINDLTEDLFQIIDLIEESWVEGSRKLIGARNTILEEYNIDSYTQILTVLSFGFLLRLPEVFFNRIGKIIKDDNVIDLLLECILASRLVDWKIRQEPQDYNFRLFLKLKEATRNSNKKEAERLLKSFLENDFIKEKRKAQMFIEPNKDWYYGMWSFESAALVAILNLDDSSFRDNQYYPKDLVDYYRANRDNHPASS